MMRTPTASLRRLALGLGFGLLASAALTGCDVNAEDTIVLPTPFVVEFSTISNEAFTFNGSSVTVGSPFDVRSPKTIDVTSFLDAQGGFTKEEIESAQVRSVQLEVAAPAFDQNADFLDNVVFKLEADGLSATEVATQDDFPDDDDRVQLSVIQGRDVGRFLRADDADAVMEIVVGEVEDGTTYALTVRMEIQVTVLDV